MEETKIPVVWGIDKNYVLQAFVVMHSILQNSIADFHFIVLTSDDIEESVNDLHKILCDRYSNYSLEIRHIDGELFSDVKIQNKYLSKATYYRLSMAQLVPEYDKCIYLDCDIIVNGDLRELFEIDINDYYLAGVKDCHIIEKSERQDNHKRVLGIPAWDKYINAGVLVVNLYQLRKDNMMDKFIQQMGKENWFEDQDVLNVCCYPHIKTLPLKYNLFHFYGKEKIKLLFGLPYEREDFCFDSSKPFVLHMGGRHKPWVSKKVYGAAQWWELAEIYKTTSDFKIYESVCLENEKKNYVEEVLKVAKSHKNVAIWGFTKNGKWLCDLLLENGISNIIAIVDSNQQTWGEVHNGICVKPYEQVMKEFEDVFWIVSCQVAYPEVIERLKAAGITESSILRYVNVYMDVEYLKSLPWEYYDEQINDIAQCEYVRQITDKEQRKAYIYNIMDAPDEYVSQYAYLNEKYNFRYWYEIQR